MNLQPVMTVPFRRAALRRLVALAAVLLGGGIGMMLVPYELLGVAVPRPLAVVAGVLAVFIGGWLLFAATQRWIAADPAIHTLSGQLLLHVNPGRRRSLDHDQVRGMEGPFPCRGAQRWVLGATALRIKTTQPEGLMASDVLVGQAMVDAPLEAVARDLRAWLASNEQSGSTEPRCH